MKLSTVLLVAAATVSAAYAQDDAPATVGPGTSTSPTTTTATPSTGSGSSAPKSTTATPSTGSGSSAKSPASSGGTSTGTGESVLDSLKQKTYGSEYHMPFVRVVQARVQSDKPELVKGRFVSKFGNGDLAKGYLSAMDTVNTASVEGALMFVQAEGINQNSRASSDRCVRKNNMNYVVLYEILIAQVNETIAQFQSTWNVPEYGPMIPMDSGRCTPLTGEKFPPECYMMNGVDNYPNIGPFIGAGYKADDVRAPYPETLWFSFANTCPLKVWGEKSDANNACRAESRKGLCDIGQAPDGVSCTYAYDILGWVAIDDVVGITSIKDDSGNPYSNFTTWCQASEKHIEFAGDDKTGVMTDGLPFWEDPLNSTRNAERASKVIEIYQNMLSGDFKSTQIPASDLKAFKDLPDPDELAKKNPPCYKTVSTCNSGNGCKRSGFAQICKPCTSASAECKTDSSYKFPTLAKAKTTLSDAELTSGSKLGGKNGATGGVNGTSSTPKASSASTSSVFPTLVATAFAATVASLAL